uniref:Uncharacterized protein n=1 Tax=Lepeophtheirus salmonis TaxID=72036 RepID=A0A0K2V442_LEPSM
MPNGVRVFNEQARQFVKNRNVAGLQLELIDP